MKEDLGRKKEGILFLLVVGILAFILAGCTLVPKEKERKEAGFVIVTKEHIPERLKELIELKKEQMMKLTYIDKDKRYIVIGYGKQKGGGYSIVVKDFYATDNALYVDTCLLGPKEKPKKEEVSSCPYLVLQTSEIGLPVVFQ
ncbi:MAG: protease complex subunit PrcB family protein [Lachnospiraceae bacterium]